MRVPVRDIHNHLLPGVDDGFRSPDDALEAIRRMSEAGCRELVFTPHLNPDVYPDTDEQTIRASYDEFSTRILSEWNIRTSLAAEYMVVDGFEQRVSESADSLLTYPDRSILIEMSYYYSSPNLRQVIFELDMAGLKPILAHPERYLYMSGDLKQFDRIADTGCRFQMNLMSLTGKYGAESLKILHYLLGRGMYSFVATDLHSLGQLEHILEYSFGFFQRRKMERVLEPLLEK